MLRLKRIKQNVWFSLLNDFNVIKKINTTFLILFKRIRVRFSMLIQYSFNTDNSLYIIYKYCVI